GAFAAAALPFTAFGLPLLVEGLHVFLELVDVDQAVLVGVPLVALGLQRLGHLLVLQEPVAIAIHPLESLLGEFVDIHRTPGAAGTAAPARPSATAASTATRRATRSAG